jgi:hypothetical protein
MNVFRYAVRSLLKLFGQGEEDLVMLKPRYDLLNEKLLYINLFIYFLFCFLCREGEHTLKTEDILDVIKRLLLK